MKEVLARAKELLTKQLGRIPTDGELLEFLSGSGLVSVHESMITETTAKVHLVQLCQAKEISK